MVLTLGCTAPLGAPAWRAIDEFYPLGSGGHWVLANDFSEPSNIAAVLGERGYTPVETWDRIVAQGAQPALWRPYAPGAELVTSSNATEWAGFVRNCFGMPSAITAWLLALSDRNGWIHGDRRASSRDLNGDAHAVAPEVAQTRHRRQPQHHQTQQGRRGSQIPTQQRRATSTTQPRSPQARRRSTGWPVPSAVYERWAEWAAARVTAL